MDDEKQMLRKIKRNLGKVPKDDIDLPEAGESISLDNPVELFTERLSAVDGRPFVVEGEKGLRERLESYLGELEIEGEIQFFEDKMLKREFPGLNDLENVVKSKGAKVSSLFEVEASITPADYLLADTGSCVISSGTPGGTFGALIPPHHIVIAESSSILPDFQALCETGIFDSPRVNLISGPSRTADIEKKLVLGMHGPLSLGVFIVL